MKQKKSLKLIFALTVLATIGGVAFFKDMHPKPRQKCVHSQTIKNPRVKKIFSYLKKGKPSFAQTLLESGAVDHHDLNEAYKVAVNQNHNKLAVKIYQLGATDCFDCNQDILLISLRAGDLKLADSLIDYDYPMDLSHVHAAKSLINVDQPNWAFMYKKEDADDQGYREYQTQCKAHANQILEIYNEQHPNPEIEFLKTSSHREDYHDLFGKKANLAFKDYLKKVLSKSYSFDIAKHGTQKRIILLNDLGQEVGIFKSKNELLAYDLDQEHFAKVPPVAEIFIPEYGEVVVQKWVPDTKMVREHQFKATDQALDPALIEQLHHVRMLDIRIGNSDRNRGNLLVKKHKDHLHLIPIDHDLIMFYIPNDFEWNSYYLSVPFTQITQQQISQIDIEKDAHKMRALDYSEEEIKSMKLRSTLLKMCSNKNLKLKEIDMLYRFYYYDFLEDTSELSSASCEQDYQKAVEKRFELSTSLISQPAEVWKLIGNNFEIYI